MRICCSLHFKLLFHVTGDLISPNKVTHQLEHNPCMDGTLGVVRDKYRDVKSLGSTVNGWGWRESLRQPHPLTGIASLDSLALGRNTIVSSWLPESSRTKSFR